ncbi:MAG: hypothetical protein KDI27_01150 [Gammaproteobacteria bacterium]|nr:hypothetical protein [Gammaproteobacteria bacterium]MCB1849612.1 hypothetical protein [Gammaproteobacteria bacterium]
MNRVHGKILHKESGLGLKDLIVALYDFDPGTQSEDAEARLAVTARLATTGGIGSEIAGDRLGSVITDQRGEFTLNYDDTDFRIRNNEKRPDLFLIVHAPDEPGRAFSELLLYISNNLRYNAGREEQYVIKLDSASLQKAGVDPPDPPDTPKTLIASLHTDEDHDRLVEAALLSIAKGRVVEKRARFDAYAQSFRKKYFETLSRFPPGQVDENRIVRDDKGILDKNHRAIRDGLNRITNPTAATAGTSQLRKTSYFLSAAQQQMLADMTDPLNLSSRELKQILRLHSADATEPEPTFLLRDASVLAECLEKTREQLCQDHSLVSSDDDASNSVGSGADSGRPVSDAGDATGGDSITKADIPQYIYSQLNSMTAPEQQVRFGVEPSIARRPSAEDVQQAVDNFSLRRSPADEPALHDFHRLHIAFDHVWQEIFDHNLQELVERSYLVVNSAGGDPQDGRYADTDPVNALNAELKIAGSAISNDFSSNKIFLRRSAVTRTNTGSGPETGPANAGVGVIVDPILGEDRFGDNRPSAPTDQVMAPIDNSNPYALLSELEKMMLGDYAFTGFASNGREYAVNFGIDIIYRQRWEPVAYQAGELVKTITLAPNESRSYSHKVNHVRKRADKEISKHAQTLKDEFSSANRAESEIIKKAMNKTNFELTADGSYNFGIAKGSSDTMIGVEAQQDSSETKKNFHEAVIKAAQEYRQERNIEVTTEEDYNEEFTESGKIENKNEEVTVSHLFYELQRQYDVTEAIHRVTPVVLVAQPLPNPRDIDAAWIVKHDWILRRVLLDDSFVPALNYLVNDIEGDRYALAQLQVNVADHRKLVADLKLQVAQAQQLASDRYEALHATIARRGKEVIAEDTDGFLGDFKDSLFGGGQSIEGFKIMEDAAREQEQRAVEKLKELTLRFEREVTALNTAVEKYTALLAKHKNNLVQVARIRVHVMQNIIYYMQAIWSHEPPDQRFLRLQSLQVPTFEGELSYRLVKKEALSHLDITLDEDADDLVTISSREAHKFEIISNDLSVSFDRQTLVEVADLDNLVGFKGNYMIFPLKQSNPLTEYMMAPYVDNGFALLDPDEAGNMSLQDFARLVCCLHDKLEPERFDEIKPLLKKHYAQLLKSTGGATQRLVVPTGSLFIVALPGTHALLEDFKLMHRALDVKKVQAEVREAELENIRAAARLLVFEDTPGMLDDPDIDKLIMVKGDKAIDIDIDPVDA